MKREEIKLTREELKSILHSATGSVKDFVMSEDEFIDEQLKQLEELPKLEVSKWYADPNNLSYVYFITNTCSEQIKGYGFLGGAWRDEFNLLNYSVKNDRPATDKEVETALIAEAKKRGFKEGGSFTAIRDTQINDDNDECRFYSKNKATVCNFEYVNEILYTYGSGRYIVFEKGKWATIIKEPTIHLEGDYTEVQLKDILNNKF